MKNHYHNTTDSNNPDLGTYENKARSQEELILDWFNQGRAATPSMVCRIVFRNRVPLTSVRRALSNLTKQFKLEKSDIQREGQYGRPEYVWRLPLGQRSLF